MMCNLVILNIHGCFILSSTELNQILIDTYKFGLMSASVYFSMTVIEVTVIRFMTIFVWRRVPPIEDQFAVTFLTVLNIFVSVMVGGSRFHTKEDLMYDAKFLGADPLMVPEASLNMK